jgi:AcrR family transcriptional regulator
VGFPLAHERPARERADAARNRVRVLAAAERLFAQSGGREVTMEQIAGAAEVGKGTLYRRYPDVASIAQALLDEHERALQDDLLQGPPPLGPGAPPAERLVAFLEALVRLTEDNLNVLLAVDTASVGRVHVGAYRAWRLHVAYLLGELRPDLAEVDRGWFADALLGPLDSGLYAFARRDQGLSAEAIAENLRALAGAISAG